MTYQEKMVKAIAAAEKWQTEVDHLEKEAEQRARTQLDREAKALNRPYPQAVLIHRTKVELKDDILYARATGNRNAQQTLAQMYGTAALVAAQYGINA